MGKIDQTLKIAVPALDALYRKGVDEHSIVSVTDVKGNILHVNDLFCSISGYGRDELIGQNHRIVKSDEHSRAVFAEMWRHVANGNVWHGELKNRKKDGGCYWVKTSIMPVLNTNGKPERYISIRTDITDRKLAEAELLVSRDKVAAALKVKTEFLSRMNHEIRTPLNGIIGMAEVLEDLDLDSDQMECLKVIQSSSDHLLQLLINLLDLENIGVESTELDLQKISVADYCAGMERQWGEIAKQRGVRLVVVIAPDLPKHLIFDTGKTDRIYGEMLKNAFASTTKGAVSVLIRPGVDGTVVSEIRDTGTGIAADALGSIFEPFEQVDNSYSRSKDGAGIGLALIKEMVEGLGGQIGVSSNIGKGSLFWFKLPMLSEMPY